MSWRPWSNLWWKKSYIFVIIKFRDNCKTLLKNILFTALRNEKNTILCFKSLIYLCFEKNELIFLVESKIFTHFWSSEHKKVALQSSLCYALHFQKIFSNEINSCHFLAILSIPAAKSNWNLVSLTRYNNQRRTASFIVKYLKNGISHYWISESRACKNQTKYFIMVNLITVNLQVCVLLLSQDTYYSISSLGVVNDFIIGP